MEYLEYQDDEWGRKGATLSDKTASSEYGLTRDEIIAAIRAGKLQYRQNSTHGNPWVRLLRREVEELARTLGGESHFKEQQARTELAHVNREMKKLRTQLNGLEKRRAVLLADLGEG
jgi:hypothetical protein